MTRQLHLNRDQAEKLDEILEQYVKNNGDGFDLRMIDVAEQLRETWGWLRWDKRQPAVIDSVDYEEWLTAVERWLTIS